MALFCDRELKRTYEIHLRHPDYRVFDCDAEEIALGTDNYEWYDWTDDHDDDDIKVRGYLTSEAYVLDLVHQISDRFRSESVEVEMTVFDSNGYIISDTTY